MAWRLFGRHKKPATEFTSMMEYLSRNAPIKKRPPLIQERTKIKHQVRKVPIGLIDARRVGLQAVFQTNLTAYQEIQFKNKIFDAHTPEEIDKVLAEMREQVKRTRK